MKLVKILVLLLVIGGLVALVANYTGGEGASAEKPTKQRKAGEGGVAVEEKYGFTSEQAGQ